MRFQTFWITAEGTVHFPVVNPAGTVLIHIIIKLQVNLRCLNELADYFQYFSALSTYNHSEN